MKMNIKSMIVARTTTMRITRPMRMNINDSGTNEYNEDNKSENEHEQVVTILVPMEIEMGKWI
jgi:hypothetical protein